MKYGETVIETLAKEIEYMQLILSATERKLAEAKRENEDLRKQLEEVFRNQVIEPVFGEEADGKL